MGRHHRQKKRKAFNRFLEHPDPRIRGYAEGLVALDMEARAMLRFAREEDFFEPKDDPFEMECEAAAESLKDISNPNGVNVADDDIPF